MNENVNDEAKAKQALQGGVVQLSRWAWQRLKAFRCCLRTLNYCTCVRVCVCVKPLKSFMQRFSFRLPKQRVKIVASARCCCQLLWLLLVVVLGYSTAAAAAVQSHCQEQQQQPEQTLKEAAEAEEGCSAHLFKLNKQPPFLCFPPFVLPFSLSLYFFLLFSFFFLHLINGVSMESFPPCGRREKS